MIFYGAFTNQDGTAVADVGYVNFVTKGKDTHTSTSTETDIYSWWLGNLVVGETKSIS